MAEPEPKHIATDKARSASTEHVVRYVLGVSLVLAVIAMAFVLFVN